MTTELRDLARLRWDRVNDLRSRRETFRRFASAFFFGLAISMLVALIIQTGVRHAARPIVNPIEEGLAHE